LLEERFPPEPRGEDPEREDGADARGALDEAFPAAPELVDRAVLGGADTAIDRAGARTPADGAIGTRGSTTRGSAALPEDVRDREISTRSRTSDRTRSLSRLDRLVGGGFAGSLDGGRGDSRSGDCCGALRTWLRGCDGGLLPPEGGSASRRGCVPDDGGLEPRVPGPDRAVPPDWLPGLDGGALITRWRG